MECVSEHVELTNERLTQSIINLQYLILLRLELLLHALPLLSEQLCHLSLDSVEQFILVHERRSRHSHVARVYCVDG